MPNNNPLTRVVKWIWLDADGNRRTSSSLPAHSLPSHWVERLECGHSVSPLPYAGIVRRASRRRCAQCAAGVPRA